MFFIRPAFSVRRSINLILCPVTALFAVTGCAARSAPASGSTRPEFVIPNREGTGPFSSAVKVGNVLYLAGQIGTDSTGALAKGGIGPETTAAMRRVEAVLLQAGSSLDRVFKCTVMIGDMKEWAVMNEAYVKFFPKQKPARSSFGANGLAVGAHVEIECMATVD